MTESVHSRMWNDQKQTQPVPQQPINQQYISLYTAARMIDFTASQIKAVIRAKKIPTITIFGEERIDRQVFERYIEEQVC